jgi:hypothetical protein
VLGEAEVSEVDVLVRPRRDEDVGRLDVAVHEAERVRGGEAGRDLGHDPHGVCGVERPVGADERAEVGALDEAHGQEERPFDLAGLVDRDDVRVVDRGRELRLALEALAEARVVSALGRDQLERDRSLQDELRRAIDDAHAAAARALLDAVAGDARACDVGGDHACDKSQDDPLGDSFRPGVGTGPRGP